MEIVMGIGAVWVAAAAVLTGALAKAAAAGDLGWRDLDCTSSR